MEHLYAGVQKTLVDFKLIKERNFGLCGKLIASTIIQKLH